MIDTRISSSESTDVDDSPGSTRTKAHSGVQVFLIASISAFLFSLVVSNDWIFASVVAAVCAGVGSVAIMWLIRRLASDWRMGSAIRFGVPIVVGLACSFLSILNTERGFEYVFGVSMPMEIGDARIQRRYAGGPGDEVTMLWFHATPATFDALIEARGLRPDAARASKVEAGEIDVQRAVESCATIFRVEAWSIWRDTAPRATPEYYEWASDATERVRVIYDRQSGFAIAIHGIG